MLINKAKSLGLTFLFIIIFVAGVGITSSVAQTYPKQPLTWGIKGGVAVSNFYGDAVSGSEVNTGFSGGIFLNYRFNDYWALQPEVIYSKNGAELDAGLTGENGSVQYDLHYLTIPVLAKFYIPTGSLATPHIYAGPQVGFKLYGEANSNELDDKLKDTTFGLAFGAGVNLDVASSPSDFIRTVGLDARYALGLTDVFDTPAEPEAKNGVFLSSLIIGF